MCTNFLSDYISKGSLLFCFTGFTEMDHGREPERVTETLQLFPLNSYYESDPEKWTFFQKECESTQMEREMDYPPLDLRLSFF